MSKIKTMKVAVILFLSISIFVLISPLYINNEVSIEEQIRSQVATDKVRGYQLVTLVDNVEMIKKDVKDDTFASNFIYYASKDVTVTSTYEKYLKDNIKYIEKYRTLAPRNSELEKGYKNIITVLERKLVEVQKLVDVKVTIIDDTKETETNIDDVSPIPYANPLNGE